MQAFLFFNFLLFVGFCVIFQFLFCFFDFEIMNYKLRSPEHRAPYYAIKVLTTN